MNWTVKYRDKNGKTATMIIDADSRSALFSKLGERKITALSVHEGASVAKSRRIPLVKSALVIIGVLAIIVLIAILINDKQPSSPQSVNRHKLTVAKTECHPTKHETSRYPSQKHDDSVVEIKEQQFTLVTTNAVQEVQKKKAKRVIPPRPDDLKPKRFKHNSENIIASLMEVQPGQMIVGELPFNGRFMDDLLKALNEPVEIKPEDDDYTKELKRAVQEQKEELRDIIKKGEDPCAYLKAARKELQELGIYRMKLVNELDDLRKSGNYTSSDMRDFVDAANKLLESKGVNGITVPKFFLKKLEFMERKENIQ